MKKTLLIPALIAGLSLLAGVLQAGDEAKKADRAAAKKCVEIMKDKRVMEIMMARIAGDDSLRMEMFGKMMEFAKSRPDRMDEISGAMMGDTEMKASTMDTIAAEDSMRMEMMEKMMKHAKGHPDEIKSMGSMMRQIGKAS